MIDQTYSTFVTRVSDGRHLSYTSVDQIAEGRVWSGTNAQDLKLTDVMGGLNTAVELAAKKAKLDNYRLVELPRIKEDLLTQIVNELSDDFSEKILQRELAGNYKYFRFMQKMVESDRIQTRLPYQITVH
jgi:protease-4